MGSAIGVPVLLGADDEGGAGFHVLGTLGMDGCCCCCCLEPESGCCRDLSTERKSTWAGEPLSLLLLPLSPLVVFRLLLLLLLLVDARLSIDGLTLGTIPIPNTGTPEKRFLAGGAGEGN